MLANARFGFAIGVRHMLGQWHRAKLTIGCRIDFYWQGPPYLVDHASYLSCHDRLVVLWCIMRFSRFLLALCEDFTRSATSDMTKRRSVCT